MSNILLPAPQDVVARLRPFYPPADGSLAARVLDYMALLAAWNTKVNLTSLRSPHEWVTRHFGESFFAATLAGLERGTLVDVGSGAGFPGLALKLVRPELSVVLLEPNRKKCAFLAEVARALELEHVQIVPKRSGEAALADGSAEFATFRAVGEHKKLLAWLKNVVKPGGNLMAWVSDAEAERISATQGWVVVQRARIPGSAGSFVLVLTPG
jgi:16S rRNA (guanine527-N7)-methyltransferase